MRIRRSRAHGERNNKCTVFLPRDLFIGVVRSPVTMSERPPNYPVYTEGAVTRTLESLYTLNYFTHDLLHGNTCPLVSRPLSDDTARSFGAGNANTSILGSLFDEGLEGVDKDLRHCCCLGPSLWMPLPPSLPYCKRRESIYESFTYKDYHFTMSRGPSTCTLLMPVELDERDGTEGPSMCRASGLHPQQE
jgi:hypothetical protein